MLKTRITLFKVLMIFIGVLMIIFSLGDAIAVWKKDYGKIYDKSKDDYIVDELVTGKIEFVVDAVAQLESSQTVYGIPVKKSVTPYYLCYVEYETEELWGYYIIVHATDEDSIKAMKDIMFSPSSAAPIAMEFKTRTVPDEVMDYTLEYMVGDELSEQDARMILAPLMLEEADFQQMKFLPLIGLIITIIPIIWIIVSRRKTVGYKSSRTHYVNEAPTDPYNTAPVAANGTPAAPMKRYSSGAYEAHTAPGGLPQQQETPYGGPEGYEPGEMDSIDTSNLNL